MRELFDPLRHKQVAHTPEEAVRQWFICELLNTFAVPAGLMMSETGFEFGQKKYRADILIYDRALKPLAVVECKRPSVKIDASVVGQAMRYNAALDLEFLFLTNGSTTFLYGRKDGKFEPLPQIITYEQMLLCRQ